LKRRNIQEGLNLYRYLLFSFAHRYLLILSNYYDWFTPASHFILTFKVSVLRDTLLLKNPTRRTISKVYFDKELYMFRTDLLSIIRSLNTVHTTIGICHTSYADCLLAVC
jgi:hypothetical protein